MYTTVGRLSSYISQGVYTVSGPFHPFGGAVDIVVVEQQDGTFKCTPWYVKFGKFQGVLKRREKTVAIGVNDVPAGFHMYLDHKGEAYFLEDASDDDEKQPFSPPSGPSSGDEATPALEYKTEAEAEAKEGNENENDSSDEQEEVGELQFACEETSEGVSRAGSQERAQIYDLLSEGVGEGSGPATSLFANSALVSIQKVAGGDGVEAKVETSVVREEQEEVASFTSKNGEYLINSYEVTQVVDNSFVIKSGEENVQQPEEISEQDEEVNGVSSSEPREPVEEQVSGSEMILSTTQESQEPAEAPSVNLKASAEQEKAWTEVITKAAAALQKEPAQKAVSEAGNVERRTWGWWVWRGSGASAVKKPESKQQKLLKPEQSLKIEELPADEGSAQPPASESKKGAAQQQRSRSMLGMMFGGNREQQKEINPDNVVELLDNRWGGKSKEAIVETIDEQAGSSRAEEDEEEEQDVEKEEIEEEEEEEEEEEAPATGGPSEPRKERSITNNVDLSTAEVVLMSVDGHVVVAKQDESQASPSTAAAPRDAGDEQEAGEYQEEVEEQERLLRSLTTASPISVPGKRLLEMAESGPELKVGSESTLDTSPCRAEIGRLSNSLSSYFEDHQQLRERKSSAAVEASASASQFSADESEAEPEVEAMEKASMDVQVGSPWSTVSILAASTARQDPEAGKTEQPERQASKNPGFELSLCRHLLNTGMGVAAAGKVFDEHKLTLSSFTSSASLMGNEALVVRVGGKYYPSGVAASILFGLLAFGQVIPPKEGEPIKVEESKELAVKPDNRPAATGGWRFWPFAFRRAAKPSEAGNVVSGDALLVATEAALHNSMATGLIRNGYYRSTWKLRERTLIPTSEQLASLNLKPGRNKITFSFTTRMLGQQQVDARIYLWKWNAKVVVSDVDGTITKSDVLGQVMPLVGRDWTQTGVTRLFSAIKDNGYELMFLSARAISQAYLTRQFLINLKQDGAALPDGPVVISPDGLFPSLYREVIRRAPHEFKIACLEDIKSLFPAESQPFYAGFGNRDTDEISYLKVGIPKGKIFIINPKGEVIVNNILDMKSYTSLHKLVNDMFPPVNLTEREDFNSWNYWKMPIPSIDD